MSEMHREQREQSFRLQFERTLDERLNRSLAISHQPIIADHYFAHVSNECLHLYTDGYFTSCITVTQSVGEGIINLITERNKVGRLHEEKNDALAQRLREQGIVTGVFCDAHMQIYGSYRNDFHHMCPKIGNVDLEVTAKGNILALCAMESEIFACEVSVEGKLLPLMPKYWEIRPDGEVPVFVRLG
jgi:hypothetical protein